MNPLFDTHAHLADPQFEGQLDDLIERARRAGLQHILVVATTASDSTTVVELSSRIAGLVAAVAVHPNHVAQAAPGDLDRVAQLAALPEVHAIGETGLDRYWAYTPFDQQREAFDFHLDLARQRQLPVAIHCRDCYPELISHLENRGGPIPGILHSFTGSRDDAERLLALGLHLSFAGMLTFKNRALDPLREVAATIPAERLLIETDCPYLSPHPHRGQRNEPALVAHTAATLASLRGLDLQTLARLTTANACTLLRIAPPSPTLQSFQNSHPEQAS